MKKILFKGCGTAICTPFNDSGVNFEEFKKLINFQVDNGADAITVSYTHLHYQISCSYLYKYLPYL